MIELFLSSKPALHFIAKNNSLTTAPAKHFCYSKSIGRIVKGFQAGLIVLNGDPAEGLTYLSQ